VKRNKLTNDSNCWEQDFIAFDLMLFVDTTKFGIISTPEGPTNQAYIMN